MALKGKLKTVASLNMCRQAYAQIQLNQMSSLCYVPLDFYTVHIRVYSNGFFQNLPAKHFQIGFVFVPADGIDCCSIFHWHSSCTTCRPAFTEGAELLILDVAMQRLRNHRRIAFQLHQKEVLAVVYVDNQTL